MPTLFYVGAAPWYHEQEVPPWVHPAGMLNPIGLILSEKHQSGFKALLATGYTLDSLLQSKGYTSGSI